MVVLMFDLIERTLSLDEVEDSEIGNGDEPTGLHVCCYFEDWSEAARALSPAAEQAQCQLLLCGGHQRAEEDEEVKKPCEG